MLFVVSHEIMLAWLDHQLLHSYMQTLKRNGAYFGACPILILGKSVDLDCRGPVETASLAIESLWESLDDTALSGSMHSHGRNIPKLYVLSAGNSPAFGNHDIPGQCTQMPYGWHIHDKAQIYKGILSPKL